MLPQAIWDISTASYRGFSGNDTSDASKLKPFGAEVDAAIKAHAEAEYPKEACGLVVDGEYMPCENKSETPHSTFLIDPELCIRLQNKIQAVAHSHPTIMPYPSKVDMQQQELLGIPWAIATVSCDGFNDPSCIDLFWFGDTLPILPLEGRAFRPGVQDCYALVRDWFRLQGTELPVCPRDDAWWMDDVATGRKKINLFDDYFAQSGWFQIDQYCGIKEGDAFVVPYYTEVLCHCGIFVGEDEVLHHMSGQTSRREPHWKWLRRATEGGKLFRHESMR